MTKLNRRQWLIGTAAVSAGSLHAGGANEQLVLGVIGCGGRGTHLARAFAGQENTEVAYVCDPDDQRAGRAKELARAKHADGDLRRILDDKSVDAVVIAACDHWHAPAAVLACEAGKHVYVEKPCSHNLREGRQIIEAANKNRRVVQHGTQTRSKDSMRAAIQQIHDGAIGDVLIAKHVNSQKRANIGHRDPSQPPEHLDYDLWVGPATFRPYQSNFVHYHWHWFFNFGTGDIGNDGVHGIDLARWGLGVDRHPNFVSGYGSKVFFDDDQEFPDTYSLTFEYADDDKSVPKKLLIYEQRIWTPYRHDHEGNNLYFYGTQGMATVGQGGLRIYRERNKLVKHQELPPGDDDLHQRNFLAAIRNGAPLTADINEGHLSSSLCHLGNIVARTGRNVRFDPDSEKILDDQQAHALLSRHYRDDHWAALS
jgi:predicted dehydrogenase